MKSKSEDTAQTMSNTKVLKRLFTYTRPYKKIFSLAVLTTILLTALAPVRPLLLQYTFDTHVPVGDKEMLLNMTLLIMGVLILESVIQFSDALLTNLLGQNIIKDLRLQLYAHILNLKLKYYDNTPIGTLVTRAVSDIEVIASIFSAGLIVIIADLMKITLILVVMFYQNYQLTLISLIPIPILFFATYWFKRAVQASFQDVRTQVSKLNTFVQEHITGMNIIQLFSREGAEMEKFKEINAKHRDANVRAIFAYSVFFPVVEILSSVSLGLLIWWGGKDYLAGITTVGELMAFITFINMLYRPMRQLADRFNTLQMGMVAADRVFVVMDDDAIIVNEGTVDADEIKGNVDFKDVTFAYKKEDWVLKNISFSVKQGETVALVGATGAGKSSVINLLSRLYEYNKGEITIDGINIRDYELNSLRKSIGIVLQDVFLFSDTLANNISLNNPEITREEIIAAAKTVGAHDFIELLPNGYDFNSMERGGMLSVGQRQLIAFIRAYVYDPQILILDEATSSIDSESEQLIQNAIDKITEGRTSIVIAHRLSTIQKADKIIVIDKGEITEMGTHHELLQQNGQYKRLFELQFDKGNG